MKTLPIVVTLLLLCLVTGAAARASGIEIRHQGTAWVTVDAGGTIRLRGGHIGSLERDGTVRNPGGSRIGKIDEDGTLRDAGGSTVASVATSGTLRYGGVTVGQITAEGAIHRQGRTWGTASPCGSFEDRRRVAAVLLFFSTFFDSP